MEALIKSDRESPNSVELTGAIIAAYNEREQKPGAELVERLLLGWFGIDDAYTLITGEDILNGEKSSRLQAAIWLAISRIPGTSLLKGAGKGREAAKEVDAVHDVAKAADELKD